MRRGELEIKEQQIEKLEKKEKNGLEYWDIKEDKREKWIRGYFRWTTVGFVFILLYPFLILAQQNIKPFIHHIAVLGLRDFVDGIMGLLLIISLAGALNVSIVVGNWIERKIIELWR